MSVRHSGGNMRCGIRHSVTGRQCAQAAIGEFSVFVNEDRTAWGWMPICRRHAQKYHSAGTSMRWLGYATRRAKRVRRSR